MRSLLIALFEAAVRAADPATAVPKHLPHPVRTEGRTLVVGAGKAAASMAVAIEAIWAAEGCLDALSGLVVTRYGHGLQTRRITVMEAGHPVPDEAGLGAARSILEAVEPLGPDDLVLCLLSGGGSALLTLPAPGVALEEKRALNRALLRSGATIAQINTVRKHLSAIKGGRLAAAAYPARTLTLAISDVPNDDVSVIASGPTVADPSTTADALAILEQYGNDPGPEILAHLRATGAETPKPGDPRLAAAELRLIATPQDSLEAAAKLARAHGFTPLVLGDLEGEARDVALVHAGIARQIRRFGQPVSAPAIILSGGETTVTVRGTGRGGRNAEFLAALLANLEGAHGIWGLACDTDGIDGTEDNAGAWFGPQTFAAAVAAGVRPSEHLANNDGYGLFERTGGLIVTGPTRTNVNDFRAVIIEA